MFSLGEWSPQIPTGFHVSRGTQEIPRVKLHFAYRIITVCDQPFHTVPLCIFNPMSGSYNPRLLWFGLFRVRSPLLTESLN